MQLFSSGIPAGFREDGCDAPLQKYVGDAFVASWRVSFSSATGRRSHSVVTRRHHCTHLKLELRRCGQQID
jgi:hypothetical protein